jgi:hypothetical protein
MGVEKAAAHSGFSLFFNGLPLAFGEPAGTGTFPAEQAGPQRRRPRGFPTFHLYRGERP